MPLAELRHVRQQYLKPYSSSDARLLPANGVVVRVHRQGAQLSAGATMFPETERDLTVRNTGGIRVGDTVQPGTDTDRQLRVVGVTNGRKVRCVFRAPQNDHRLFDWRRRTCDGFGGGDRFREQAFSPRFIR